MSSENETKQDIFIEKEADKKEESSEIGTVYLTLDEYKLFISKCIERIVKEECFTVKISKSPTGNGTVVDIKLDKPEWYNNYDLHAQEVIYDNFQKFILERLKDVNVEDICKH